MRPVRLLFVAATAALGCVCGRAAAAVVGPYTPDGATLHLYHLDDAGAPAADAAGTLPMQGLLNDAALGATALPGFGTALDTSAAGSAVGSRPILLAAPALVNGAGDDVPFSHANPATGAFTMEALVKFGYDPSAAPARGSANSLQVLSMDGDASERVFQLRIDPIGFNSGTSDNTRNRVEFINIRQGTGVQSYVVNLPDAGDPNAADAGSWFHLAVAYDGNENTPNNLSVYWTKVDPSATSANLLGQTTLSNDLSAVAGDFAIGNEGRNTGGASESFIGQIDEVRISSVARTADQFVFAVPEPTGLALLAPLFALAARRTRRR